MGQSSGAGSPVWFMCPNERKQRHRARSIRTGRMEYSVPRHEVKLTGNTKASRPARGHAKGIRSSDTSRQYECQTCGYLGWSNHMDLERMAEKEAS